MTIFRPAAVAALLAAATLLPLDARADRPPTDEERVRVEQALQGLGFVAWEEIEHDDDKWEVDDARHSDGKEYDLDLSLDTLQVLKQEED